jgi:fibronectin type 3 domain-containing protein
MRMAAVALLAAAVAVSGATPAAAYWRAGGTGIASATVGALAAGSQPTASVSGHTITVDWVQSAFAGQPLGGYTLGGYGIRRYPAGGGPAVTPAAACATTVSGVTASLSCAEANVAPGAWQYTVTPVLGTWTGAESAKSASVSVAPDAPTLSVVTAQNPAAGQSTGAIAVSWSAVTGATGYNVYRRAGAGSYDFSAPLNGATPLTTNAYTDPGSGLTGGTTYAYVVRAVTTGAESASSNELSATPIARAAPPSSVAATLAPAGRIDVTWPAVSGASGYNVYRRLSTGAYNYAAPLNGATPIGTTSFADTTATNGTTYRYVVRSVVTGAGATPLESLTDSPESAAATSDATPPASATISDPGTPLRGTIVLSGTAADAGSGIGSLAFQYAPAGTSTWTTGCTDTVSPYACSFDATAVADGLYDVRSLASDVAGNTTASAIVANRRIDNTGPTATMGDPGAYVRGTITLTAAAADAGSGVASVAIQRAPTGTSTWTTVCTDTVSPYSCPLNTTTLADGGYDLRAVATDVAGNPTTSATVANRVVDNTAPTAVDIQTANAAGGTAGHPEAGDSITYTFSEPMSPGSIMSGWTGTSTLVTVRFVNGNPDTIGIWDAANTTQLALGSFTSGKKYVTANTTFSGSSMLLTGNTVVVTLGTPSATTQSPNGATTLQWTVSTGATDRAGNALTAGTIAETGGADQDF